MEEKGFFSVFTFDLSEWYIILIPHTTLVSYLNNDDDEEEAFFGSYGSLSQKEAGTLFYVMAPKILSDFSITRHTFN